MATCSGDEASDLMQRSNRVENVFSLPVERSIGHGREHVSPSSRIGCRGLMELPRETSLGPSVKISVEGPSVRWSRSVMFQSHHRREH